MKKNVFFIMVVFIVVSIAAFATGEGEQQEYPSGKVSVIIPYSAGGGSDSIVRALVDSAKADFNNNLYAENRVGGAGSVGMLYGANSSPDGSVITMIAVELTMLPHIGVGGELSPSKFKPVMMFNADPAVITVRTDSGINTVDDLIRVSKEKKLQYGTSGVGSIWHFSAAAFAKEANIELQHIPFDGSAPAVTSLLGEHIDVVSSQYGEVAPYVKSGDLKVLTTLSAERQEADPSIPTAKELGYDVALGTWRGLAVPEETPDEIVDKIYDIFTSTLNSDSFKTFMVNNNFTIQILSPEKFQERINQDFDQFGNLSKELGLGG